MGATSSRNVRKIIWCDTEGGVRGVPLWDCAFVIETESEIRGIRMCTISNISADKQRKIKNSVPQKAFPMMKAQKAQCVMTYKLEGDNWRLESWDMRQDSVSALVNDVLQAEDGGILAAWNMKCHDRHVLASCVEPAVIERFQISDPLIEFRKRIGLPKNSMATARSGTPRGVFAVSHSYMGPAHTAMTDVLNMRLVCLRAFHNVRAAQGSKEALALRLSQPTSYKCVEVPRNELFSASYEIMHENVLASSKDLWEPVMPSKENVEVPIVGWMWEPKFWKPRELDSVMIGEFKERFMLEARKMKKDNVLTALERQSIASIKNEVDVLKCLEQFTS